MRIGDDDFDAMNKRWSRAKQDLLDLMTAALKTNNTDNT